MAFDLTMGSKPAQELQDSIQDELQKRGFSPDADPVMAEYITIMLINNKTPEQITAELQDLIGVSEYDPSFTDWLFAEAAKKSQPATEPVPEPAAPAPSPSKPEERSSSPETARRAPTGPRAGTNQLYNHAINQALPTGQKRTASARSPSPVPDQPSKSRRTDLPTGPRAMHARESGQRSLLDRMGGRQHGGPRHGRDEIQARIDAVTNQSAVNGMNGGYNPAMGGMMMPGNEMAAAAAMGGMMNPLALQEMMMNQMALMAQMANNMGLLNNQGQFTNANEFPNGGNMQFPDGQQQQQQQQQIQQQQRRSGSHPGRGGPRGPLKAQWVAPHIAEANKSQGSTSSASPPPATIASPTPKPAAAASPEPATPGFTPPERPQSPSLCKFGLKCTNALCRYSHPSPVATAESGMVLSNDPCEAGIKCKDKDCIKSHVSPAAAGVTSIAVKPKPKVETAPSSLKPPCRYGANCTKAPLGTCPFSHPFIPKSNPYAQTTQCRFGAACTRATCPFQHPPGRVLPGTFHRGLSENTPTVSVRTPQTGTMATPSANRTVVFNKPSSTAAPATADKDKSEQKPAADGENATVEAAA